MPSIKFERYERDCPANHNARAAGEKLPWFDFRVLIDDEFRAIMSRQRSGYEVVDANHRPIKTDYRYAHEVKSKAQFETEITSLLDQGLIPTLARMAELRAAEAAETAAKKAAEAERLRVYFIQQAGVELYEALKLALRHMDGPRAPSYLAEPIKAAKAALAKAERPVTVGG